MIIPAGTQGAGEQLLRASLTCLGRFAPDERGLMPRTVTRTRGGGLEYGSPSVRGTAEAVRGAFHARRLGIEALHGPERLLSRLMEWRYDEVDPETAALIAWAGVAGGQGPGASGFESLVRRFRRARASTLAWSWAVAAMAEAIAGGDGASVPEETAARSVAELSRRQDPRTGLFFGKARRAFWQRRRRDGALSSQAFAVIALASFGSATGLSGPVQQVRACADRLCELQGPLGQWWRRYDASRGTVLAHYEVHTVMQDAVVPWALAVLDAAATEPRYRTAVQRGLDWVMGHNEVGRPLVNAETGEMANAVELDEQGPVVAETVYLYHPARYLSAAAFAASWLGLGDPGPGRAALRRSTAGPVKPGDSK